MAAPNRSPERNSDPGEATERRAVREGRDEAQVPSPMNRYGKIPAP